jgi:leucine dehydrogenase
LQGKYITAVDSGTSPADMDIINQYSQYVVCTTAQEKMGGGASRYTALGVRRGIEAAVKFKLGKDSLAGIHVAIQGAGNVSYYLAKELHILGAKLTLCDINNKKAQEICQEFNAEQVQAEEIYNLPCDVFAPCALGGILNPVTIPLIQAPIIAGAANNQLDSPNSALLLQQRSILYVPDFAINSGGLIYAAAMYNKTEASKIQTDTEAIYNTVMDIFSENKITPTVAC